MIKNVRVDWENEHHTFTFDTGGDKLEALDFLKDFIGSVEELYRKISKDYEWGDEMPEKFKVHGGCTHTTIKAVSK